MKVSDTKELMMGMGKFWPKVGSISSSVFLITLNFIPIHWRHQSILPNFLPCVD